MPVQTNIKVRYLLPSELLLNLVRSVLLISILADSSANAAKQTWRQRGAELVWGKYKTRTRLLDVEPALPRPAPEVKMWPQDVAPTLSPALTTEIENMEHYDGQWPDYLTTEWISRSHTDREAEVAQAWSRLHQR